MGTDIHPVVQVRSGDQWETVELPKDIHAALSDRNYDAFAILGNVRNGYGFAGSDTGDEFQPISDGRGLPDDFESPFDNKYAIGDHSFSWVTLQELLGYPWAGQVTRRGWILADKYEFWARWDKEEGLDPSEYRSAASGANVASVDEGEYQSLKTLDRLPKVRSLYVRSSWRQRNSLAVGRLYSVVIPYLQTIGAPADVRIVFGFDS